MSLLYKMLPVMIIWAGALPLLGLIALISWMKSREIRRSPLTKNLLRSPGYSLRAKISDAEVEVVILIVATLFIPLIVFAFHISDSYFTQAPESNQRMIVSLLTGIFLVALAGWKLIGSWKNWKLALLGLDGELATGEELNQLMLQGCRVFHDIPFPRGNVDHVVVSESGVFAVNSKLMGKLRKGCGTFEVTVDHNKDIVVFPDRVYQIPIQKFAAEAKWLKQHLTSAVGQPIEVESILALPGWFIKERIGKSSVYVINPFKPQKFFVSHRRILSSELVQRVSHQLEQLCRDVEPAFQHKRKRWEDKS